MKDYTHFYEARSAELKPHSSILAWRSFILAIFQAHRSSLVDSKRTGLFFQGHQVKHTSDIENVTMACY